ncbi:hypothetical protein LTR17_001002 [Elasticomyces elasticus]|nr:hypothetical protein LTR17_001002 [Elasticomyces elasticus]
MSLNGLDTPEVRDAYQRSIAEAGGWFLLKYTSRDSVELLGQGKGGVHEARTAIAKYEDPSPLYGLLIYRRRKVLIKFIPEGTSRLLQARTAVHFQDVMERYAPYETMLEITTAESLNDTSLAASFPLHTASPSTSSNRLHEISEDGEDHGQPSKRPPPSHSYAAPAAAMFGTQRYKTEKRVDQLMTGDRAQRRPTPSIQVTSESGQPPISSPLASPALSAHKTSLSQFLVHDESGQRSITSLTSQPSVSSATDYACSDVSGKSGESAATASEHSEAAQAKPVAESPLSSVVERPLDRPSQTAERLNSGTSERSVKSPSVVESPSLSESVNRKADDEPYDFSRFDIKPKVKLGPRPVATGERTKRQVASIAAVPASFRPVQKKSEPSRQQSFAPVNATTSLAMPALPRPPPIPDTPEYNPRPVSRGSVKSLPSHKSTNMTPDKIRLMKAVELRKKQLRKSNPQPSTFVPPADEDAPAVPALPVQHDVAPTPQTQEQPQAPEPEVLKEDEQPIAFKRPDSKKPDSGIEMNYEDPEKRENRRSMLQHVEQSRPTSTNETVLLQLQPSPTLVDPAKERTQSFEPTMSMDMLDDTPMRAATPSRALPKVEKPKWETEVISATPQRLETSVMPITSPQERTRPVSPLVQQLQLDDARVPFDQSPISLDGTMTSSGTLEPPASPRRINSDLAKRRRGIVEPLHVDSHADGEIGSDDDLMDELHVATVHQAKPISLARSPMASNFPRRPSAQSMGSDRSPSVRSINIRRSSSNLLEKYENTSDRASPPPMPSMPPAHLRAQSVVTPPPDRADTAQSLRRNGSSNVTKRIQTLTETNDSDDGLDAASPEPYPPSTWRERKSSVRSPPRSRTNSYKAAVRHSGRLSGWGAQQTNALQQAESTPTWNVQHDPSINRDSVSVTARIVRPNATAGAEETGVDSQFHQPQLMINHKRASATQQGNNLNKALPPLNTDSSTTKPDTSSLATSPTLTRGSSDTRTLHSAHNRKSFGRYKQQTMSPMTPSPEDFPAPPMKKTDSTTSVTSSNEQTSIAPGEVGSRTSRFFKRMSNLGGVGKDRRRSGAQQSLGGSPNGPSTIDVGRTPSVQHDRSDMPPAASVGNLNVQFPDSLLWKRRIVEIDDAGYLLFSIPQALDVQKGTIKRFHLSEFRMPCAPDLDRQELPHSIMLDFADGGTTLQAACEDAMTSRQVLFVLRSYWKAWSNAA